MIILFLRTKIWGIWVAAVYQHSNLLLMSQSINTCPIINGWMLNWIFPANKTLNYLFIRLIFFFCRKGLCKAWLIILNFLSFVLKSVIFLMILSFLVHLFSNLFVFIENNYQKTKKCEKNLWFSKMFWCSH